MEPSQLAAHRSSARIGEVDLAYLDVGEGPPALFVHGVFLNSALGRDVIDGVRDIRRCIAVDLPAHGATRVPSDQDFSLAAQADLLDRLCDELGLDTVDAVANDTGGAVVQVFAARHPERLRSLVLTNCDTHDNFPPELFKPMVEMARQGQLVRVIEGMLTDLDATRSQAGLGIGFEDPGRLTDDVLRAYVEPAAASPDAAALLERYIASVDAAELMAIEPALKGLNVPTLVVWGTGDVFFDISRAHWLRDTIPGVREVVEIDGARLFFPDERGAELAGHLTRFWDALAAA